jgi:hypothetical protein
VLQRAAVFGQPLLWDDRDADSTFQENTHAR